MNIKKIAFAAVIATLGLGIALTQGQSFGAKSPQGSAPKPAPLVSVTAVRTRDVPLVFAVQGHVTPLNQVDVRPQLTAIIKAVHFHEGERVTAGQLLFTLDGSDASASLNRARAQAAQVKAQLDDAQRGYSRSRQMVGAGFIAPSAADTDASKVEGLRAQLAAAQADIDNARVQLERTRIVAPISGKTGAVSVYPGSLAQPAATAALVTIIQLDPIGVEFELPEQHIAALPAGAAVSVALDAGDGSKRQGRLTFIDSTVNTGSGTIALKASFANKDQALWAGAFVRVALEAGFDKGATVLPPHAVLDGPQGRFVYVVGADSKVALRPVGLLRVQDQDAIVTGVRDGEQVVVEGGQQLRAGTLVRMAVATLPGSRP